MKHLQNKGQADLAITLATTAIVLLITVLVLGNLLPVGLTSVGGAAANTTNAYAAVSNITSLTWTSMTLTAVGLIVIAGFGLIGLMLLQK